jgi:hypothetical protein
MGKDFPLNRLPGIFSALKVLLSFSSAGVYRNID